jgi:hypothetical protein
MIVFPNPISRALGFAKYNSDLLKIADSLYTLANSTDSAVVAHRHTYFERNPLGVYNDAAYSSTTSWSLMNMIYSVARRP